MPITIEQYIAQFEELDEYGEYATRLKEELTDHFEDSVHTAMVFGTKELEAKEKALQKLGESQRIIHEFKTIMKFNNKWALWLESWFIGILSIPFFHFMFLMFGFGVDTASTESIAWKSVLVLFALYLISSVFLALFYYCTIGRLLRFVEKKKQVYLFAVGLFIPPIVFAFLYSEFTTYSYNDFFSYLSFAIVPGMVDFYCYVRSAFKKKRDMVMNPDKKQEKVLGKTERFLKWVPLIFSLVCIPLIFFTNYTFIPLDSSYNRNISDSLTFIRSLLESINLPILDFHIDGMFGGYEGFYILASIYIFLAIISLYHIIQFFLEKSAVKRLLDFPWLRLTLLVYIFSLFFLVTPPQNSKIEWKVPVRNISTEIKQDQLGFTYKMVSHLDHRSLGRQKSLFLYEIIPGGNYFTIRVPDNEGAPHTYYLTFKNNDSIFDLGSESKLNRLNSIEDLEISKISGQEPINGFFGGSKNLPATVDCIQEKDQPIAYTVIQTFEGDGFEILEQKYCHKLLYQGKIVYTQERANHLYQFEVMPENPRFAIVKLETGEYGPQEVYLVDLGF